MEATPSIPVPARPFAPLTPINSVHNKEYGIAIHWALSQPNDKHIHNVALTGPYGSGKSSVIRTFEKDYKNCGYEFLNISLATFQDGQPVGKTTTTEPTSLTDLNRIEASILQQLFYQEDDTSIPDSRFKKIKHYSGFTRFLFAFAISCWLVSFCAIVFPESLSKLTAKLPSYPWLDTPVVRTYVPMLLFLMGVAWGIYKGIRLISRIRLNKINVFEAELEVDPSAKPSILNQHLDEIIYFFEKTPYNVVVIEDLDRFNQPEIFTKLREINTILNNSKTIHRKIVFLYAVRDDMFSDKDRAKFFDFIIPIIPVINYSNSSEKLLSISKDNNYGWDQQLIDDIALFIDDMRLLFNITNEYYLYNRSLHPSLDKNKLLALLVYKNCYPSDFVALSQGKGVLYSHIQKKQTLIDSTIATTIQPEIIKKQNELRRLDELVLKDENELKSVYLLNVIQSTAGFLNFYHQYNPYSIQQVIEEKFDLLIANQLQYNSNNGYPRNLPEFEAIGKQVDPTQSFAQRLATINAKKNKGANKLAMEIQELEARKRSCQEATLKELLTNSTAELFSDESRQSMFLNLMLRTGYIDESYLDYISIFYEGSLSRNDYDFLLAAKTRKPKAVDLPLTNVEKILSKLSLTDFSHPASYNLSLLDYMLGKDQYTSQLGHLLVTFATESEASNHFLLMLLQKRLQPQYLMPGLVKHWPNCWRFIETSSHVSDADKDAFFSLLVEHVPLLQIINLTEATSVGQYLVDKPELLSINSAQERLESLIVYFNLQFITLYETVCPDGMIELIYKGNHYKINDLMITLLVKKKDKYDPVAFTQRNYSALLETGLTEMIEFINANMDVYVTEVFLPLPENRYERETALLTLLNDDSLSLHNKQQIVKKSITTFSNLSELKTTDLYPDLLKQEKVAATWANVITVFDTNSSTLSAELISFLYKDAIVERLGKPEIPEDEQELYDSLFLGLVLCDALSDSAYRKICSLIPSCYDVDEIDLRKVSKGKLAALCDTHTLTFSSPSLSAVFNIDPALSVSFLQKNIDKLEKSSDAFPISIRQVEYIVLHSSLSVLQKGMLINCIEPTELLSHTGSLNWLVTFITNHQLPDISATLLSHLINKRGILSTTRIKVLQMYHSQLTAFDYKAFLETLDTMYASTLFHQQATWDYDPSNHWLAQQLKEQGYLQRLNKKGTKLKLTVQL